MALRPKLTAEQISSVDKAEERAWSALEKAFGFRPVLDWEINGPADTMVLRMQYVRVGGMAAIIQFFEGDGWNIFPMCQHNNVEKSMQAIANFWKEH